MQKNLTMGEKIGDLLSTKGINAQKLSDDTGIPKATISEIISNKEKNFGYKTIVKVAEYLKVSVDYLVGLEPEPTNDKEKMFICNYTGLSLNAVEKLNDFKNTLSEYKKAYQDYCSQTKLNDNELLAMSDVEDKLMNRECTFDFLNSIIISNYLPKISLYFTETVFYQAKEILSEKYERYLNTGLFENKKEREFFEEMKKRNFFVEHSEEYEDDDAAKFSFYMNKGILDFLKEVSEKEAQQEMKKIIRGENNADD